MKPIPIIIAVLAITSVVIGLLVYNNQKSSVVSMKTFYIPVGINSHAFEYPGFKNWQDAQSNEKIEYQPGASAGVDFETPLYITYTIAPLQDLQVPGAPILINQYGVEYFTYENGTNDLGVYLNGNERIIRIIIPTYEGHGFSGKKISEVIIKTLKISESNVVNNQ
jgi:hypothetical protein